MKYAIYDKDGNVDRDPEPMIFDDHATANEILQDLQSNGIYDGTYYVGIFIENTDRPIRKWTTDTKIVPNGTSLSVNITAGCRLMGVGRGDIVKVTIEKVE